MTSLHTNISAMTARRIFASLMREMDTVEKRMATGMRVHTASDNAAYWSISTMMLSDYRALKTIQDAIGYSAALTDVVYSSLEKAVAITTDIQSKLMSARQPGADRLAIQEEIKALQAHLVSVAENASFASENWLHVDSSAPDYNAIKSTPASIARAGGTLKVNTIEIDIDRIKLIDTAASASGILDRQVTLTNSGRTYSVLDLDVSWITDSTADLQDLEELLDWSQQAIDDLTLAASYVGSFKHPLDTQKDVIEALAGALKRGIGKLVDADIDAESTRIQALQMQQQLGIQALSIANTAHQSILTLFR